MSFIITLQPIPNQTISTTFDGNRYEITFKAAGDIMAIDMIRDSVVLYRGLRIVAGTFLIPYRYRENGNFFISTSVNDELPNWQLFGTEHQLYYLTASEIAGLRRGN